MLACRSKSQRNILAGGQCSHGYELSCVPVTTVTKEKSMR